MVGAIYMLRAVRLILQGPAESKWTEVKDATYAWRKAPFVLLLGGMLIFGCFPRLLTDKIVPAVRQVLNEIPGHSAGKVPGIPALTGNLRRENG